MNKEELRACMRAMRRQLSPQAQEKAAQAVFEQLAAFEPYQKSRTVMAYMACRGELSLAPVLAHALGQGKILALPRCESPGIMTARRIRSMEDLDESGFYGLREPKTGCAIVKPEEIDLILVPGVAFDRRGGRLGQGGGYYDRFLQNSSAMRVGICHDFAVMDAVPCEAHDESVNFVMTPGGIFARETCDGRT